ncbi:hypothetical protein CLOBY_10130 [Clostridium saccharobutylicum]|uniref:hypothetical protein n=1 Tax=Clostridium saccharobutylicum TaxID=169679 RepID=UPI000983FA68|nr:hypothetical protein [Clostridium saccharobutylicum]AQS08898.1 hypothetical protein CLOBY_10130 [Clostridium saccharobutylicum]MBC2437689.1 hypothetical protein [Clostridium saccharobutylicum]NSB90096.1 hypothetical protein [Clostridium saccharobutylicum]NYC28753.1 hypothetical protein [Clostridium saccharobutylicum]OOM17908.1 hypothetical protein CLSAB_11960 [Clostridium saccharobutylicum]
MIPLINTVGNASDTVIYAMDETYIRLESKNRSSWSPKDISPVLERNPRHIGANIVGANQIYGSFETFTDIYNSDHSITNKEVCNFLDYLLEINKYKKLSCIRLNKNVQSNTAECFNNLITE